MAASTSIALPRTNAANAIATWAGALQAAIDAGGFVLVADTGDADFTTLTTPGGASTVAGYRIYRSDDGTGFGLNDFYFKIEVGSGAGSANDPSMWWTFGWGSDGAGTITNTAGGGVTSRVQRSTSASTAQDTYFSATSGHFTFGMWGASTVENITISVERVRDSQGAITDAIFIYIYNGTTPILNQVVPRTTGIATNSTTSMGSYPQSNWLPIDSGNATYGADKGVGLLFPRKGSLQMPSLNLFSGNTSDFPAVGQSHSITAYGTSHTYITLGFPSAPNSAQRILMRYE